MAVFECNMPLITGNSPRPLPAEVNAGEGFSGCAGVGLADIKQVELMADLGVALLGQLVAEEAGDGGHHKDDREVPLGQEGQTRQVDRFHDPPEPVPFRRNVWKGKTDPNSNMLDPVST